MKREDFDEFRSLLMRCSHVIATDKYADGHASEVLPR